MKRRSFLAAAWSLPVAISGAAISGAAISGAAVNGALAREPVQRTGPARFRPSLAAYSLREYFSSMKGKPQKPKADGKAIDLFGFIDYCASIGSDAAELTAYFLPADPEPAYLLELKQHAFLTGVTISGTAIGNDFTVADPSALQHQIDDTIRWIERSAILGAPHLRIFAGTAKQLGQSDEKLKAICDAVSTVAKVAAQHGIFLGVENHGGIGSGQLLDVMKRVESDWVGINLDTGNFVSEDPYKDMEVCAPYAVNVQFKPFLKTAGGEKSPADLNRIASLLRSANYRGFVALEYEEEKPYERIPALFTKMVAGLT